MLSACLHTCLRSTVKQMASKSRDMYQPIESLHFLVSKLQLNEGTTWNDLTVG